MTWKKQTRSPFDKNNNVGDENKWWIYMLLIGSIM